MEGKEMEDKGQQWRIYHFGDSVKTVIAYIQSIYQKSLAQL